MLVYLHILTIGSFFGSPDTSLTTSQVWFSPTLAIFIHFQDVAALEIVLPQLKHRVRLKIKSPIFKLQIVARCIGTVRI